MNNEYEATQRMIRIIALFFALVSSSAYAQSLPDGKYIDWEEDYLVKNGKLVSCSGAGKSGNTCDGIGASYAGPRAIYLTKSGRTWLVCNLKFKKGGGMGPPGSGGYCTVNGWN
jgi:hypothetical protein